tara:strand:+ start:1811 stop:2092 length:282 start_codon:yes stop_codon:yes gene_type:complete
MNDIINDFSERIHVIAIIISLAIYGFLKFGPSWVTTLTKAAREMREKSDAVRNEYIATLEEAAKRKEKELNYMRKRLQKYREKIKEYERKRDD